jgi:hypothetical protein
MYFYRIGYNSPEDSDFYELVHKDKLSKEKFIALISEATIRALEGIVSGKYEGNFCSALEGLSFEDILEDVVNELVEVDGFKHLEYQVKWSCFGWPSVTDSKDWKEQRGTELGRLTAAIPDELKEKINEMSKKYSEENE